MATGNQRIAQTAIKSSSLSPEARLVVITSLIGWSLANMDQSFFTLVYPAIQKEFNISLDQVSYLYIAIFIISLGVLYVLWWFFAYGIYGCAITYIMESFPTRIRGMGSNFVGKFVWLSFLVYSLIAAHILGAFGVTAAVLFAMVGVAVVAFVVLLFNKNIPPRLELEEIAI